MQQSLLVWNGYEEIISHEWSNWMCLCQFTKIDHFRDLKVVLKISKSTFQSFLRIKICPRCQSDLSHQIAGVQSNQTN